MLLRAARELGLDLAASWVIGDSASDVEAGLAAGLPVAHCIRVERNRGLDALLRDLQAREQPPVQPA